MLPVADTRGFECCLSSRRHATALRRRCRSCSSKWCYSSTNDPSGARMKSALASARPPASFQMTAMTRKSLDRRLGSSQNTFDFAARHEAAVVHGHLEC
jgi:hypothetical protein